MNVSEDCRTCAKFAVDEVEHKQKQTRFEGIIVFTLGKKRETSGNNYRYETFGKVK
jgi:hypothetical protein